MTFREQAAIAIYAQEGRAGNAAEAVKMAHHLALEACEAWGCDFGDVTVKQIEKGAPCQRCGK